MPVLEPHFRCSVLDRGRVSNRQITSWSVPAIPVSHNKRRNPKAGIADVLAPVRAFNSVRIRRLADSLKSLKQLAVILFAGDGS
jgi:hypothetical protein